VLEVGDTRKTGQRRAALLEGVNFQGAAFERGPMVLFSSTGSSLNTGEVSFPDLSCESLIITGLLPDAVYELNFGELNVSPSSTAGLPGVSAGTERLRSNSKAVLRVEGRALAIYACGLPACELVTQVPVRERNPNV